MKWAIITESTKLLWVSTVHLYISLVPRLRPFKSTLLSLITRLLVYCHAACWHLTNVFCAPSNLIFL